MSFPNALNRWGFGFLAFAALAPLFAFANRASWRRLLLFAPAAALLLFCPANYWLAAYHPLAMAIASAIFVVQFWLVLPLVKLAGRASPRWGWLGQALVWVAWEFARSQGFLGYPYDIAAYTQYLFAPLANLASLTGVWGVSLLVVCPSALLAWNLAPPPDAAPAGGVAGRARDWLGRLWAGAKSMRWAWAAWAAAALAACLYGGLSMVDYGRDPVKRLALVQQNVDPWIGDDPAYEESLRRLVRQSDAALAARPDVDLVVWSETSIVPAIGWHFRYRENERRYRLVRQLLDYLASKPVPFLLGNGEAEAAVGPDGGRRRVDYNAALLFEGGRQTAGYRKMHLVPFSESFPFKDSLPGVYRWLEDNRTSFWEPGERPTVMRAAGFSFGTPICFEDSFAEPSRSFVAGGAQAIVNLSNDSWSASVPAAMQHLAMASFRAVETRRAVVRSTNGGMSGLIDPNGRIAALNEPFTESYLVVAVPLCSAPPPPAQRWGDWFAWAVAAGAAVSLAAAAAAGLRRCRANRD